MSDTSIGPNAGWAIAVHGGAGDIADTTPRGEQAALAHEALGGALASAGRLLEAGASAVDAVEMAVRALEDAPLFNAGRGAVLNAAGETELDASIMDGRRHTAGAVAAVQGVKNPITLARALMERSKSLLLIGPGARAFARAEGLELEPAEYFVTEARRAALARALSSAGHTESHDPSPAPSLGTVGAVARDRRGDLAAATSTGGVTAKPVGRVGDSALIGAGTYASNASCAVSCTGEGEYFIRATLARDVAALIEYAGLDLAGAVERAIRERLETLGGHGGVIAIDRDGRWRLLFNTPIMYRGALGSDTPGFTAIDRDIHSLGA